jgi:hypothetical protein
MQRWYYNGKSYPALPEWTKDYTYVWITDVTLGDVFLTATNNLQYRKEYVNSMTSYFYLCSNNGYESRLENGEWGPKTYVNRDTGMWPWQSYNAVYTVWSNTDIYRISDINNIEGTKSLFLAGSSPVILEWGWTDYGDDDEGVGLTGVVTSITVPPGCSIVGAWRCKVSGYDGEITSFAWEKNGELAPYTTTHGNYSDCVPTADELGTDHYRCFVTLDSGKELYTDLMLVAVKELDPGESGGSGGGDGGGNGDDGGDDGGDPGDNPGGENPTNTYKANSFWLGVALGLAGIGLPKVEKSVAYLYGHVAKEGETPTHTINGVGYVGAVLPKLTDRDKEKYPYVCIGICTVSPRYVDCFAVASVAPLWSKKSTSLTHGLYFSSPCLRIFEYLYGSSYKEPWPAWEETNEAWEIAGNFGFSERNYIFWANHDIYWDDGNLLCAASVPIPVYE